MKRVSQVLARLCVSLGAATLLLMTAMVAVDIVLRTFLHQSLGFVEEITGYLVVIVTFLGVSLTFREGAMFRVSFLYETFPSTVRQALGFLYLAATISFCVIMMWFTTLLVWSSFTRGKVAATALQTPIYIPQMVLPVGFLILFIFAVDKLLQGGGIPTHAETSSLPSDDSTGD